MPRLVVDINPKTGEYEEYYYDEPGPVPPLIRPNKVRPQRRPDGSEPDKEEREKRKKN